MGDGYNGGTKMDKSKWHNTNWLLQNNTYENDKNNNKNNRIIQLLGEVVMTV